MNSTGSTVTLDTTLHSHVQILPGTERFCGIELLTGSPSPVLLCPHVCILPAPPRVLLWPAVHRGVAEWDRAPAGLPSPHPPLQLTAGIRVAGRLLGLKRCQFTPKHKNNLANPFLCFANYNLDQHMEQSS